MPDKVSSDGSRVIITEWEVRMLDADGDTQELESYETKAEAIAAAKDAVVNDGWAAAVVEKHVSRRPAHLYANPDSYMPVATFGDLGAIRRWEGEEE